MCEKASAAKKTHPPTTPHPRRHQMPSFQFSPYHVPQYIHVPLVATADSHVPWEVYCIIIHITVRALLNTFNHCRDNSSRADLPKVCEILQMPHQRLHLMLSRCIWRRLPSHLVDWHHTCCCRCRADRSPPSLSII